MSDMDCDHCQDLIPELALGVLDGRERATALAHVEHCPQCQAELRAMGDVADRLVELTPAAEPPVGFETRTLRRLSPAPLAAPARGRSARRSLVWTSVAAALVVAVGVGGWAVGRAGAPAGPTYAGHVATAALIVGGSRAGEVVVSGGPRPQVVLAVDSHLGDRTVRCDLVERDGRSSRVGTYSLSDGAGYWAAPIGVPVASVAGLRLVDATGRAVATASFPAS